MTTNQIIGLQGRSQSYWKQQQQHSDRTQQRHSLLPVCSNSLAKRQKLEELTSLLNRGVVKTAEKQGKKLMESTEKVVATLSRKQHGICQQNTHSSVGCSWKAFAKGCEVCFFVTMTQLGDDGSSRSRPPLFFKDQGTTERGTGSDGVIPEINWPFVTAVSRRLCLLEAGGAEVRRSCCLCLFAVVSW